MFALKLLTSFWMLQLLFPPMGTPPPHQVAALLCTEDGGGNVCYDASQLQVTLLQPLLVQARTAAGMMYVQGKRAREVTARIVQVQKGKEDLHISVPLFGAEFG